jgi:hypothetical protein
VTAAAGLPTPLAPQQLTPEIDPARMSFQSTAELEGVAALLGAERALSALGMGIRMRTRMNVLPPQIPAARNGARLVLRDSRGCRRPDPLYVNNFEDPDRPSFRCLPGRVAPDDLVRIRRTRVAQERGIRAREGAD